MADAKVRNITGPVALRVQSGLLLSPSNVANLIENFVVTEEGTLRSVWGPTPYLTDATGTPPLPYDYGGTLHGIGHGLVNGGSRDILLVHAGPRILEYRGWSRSWRSVIANDLTFGTPLYQAELIDDSKARVPTQFVATPSGMVIIPQDSIAYYYDGDICRPLGYSNRPNAPAPYNGGIGSSEPSEILAGDPNNGVPGLNDILYAYDAQRFTSTGVWTYMGKGRVGTVETFPGAFIEDPSAAGFDEQNAANGVGGQLLDGTYVAATQWVDMWGNLSPVSNSSTPFNFAVQRSRYRTDYFAARWVDAGVEDVLKLVAWQDIAKGPSGTIGRILLRSKDMKHAGSTALWELPPNAGQSTSAFATIPDNTCTAYPDNTPDSWLIRKALEPVPVRAYKFACMAFGRLWTANWDGDPGVVHPSVPGRWGTYLDGDQYYPDPQSKGVTGLYRAQSGLLVFSENNTFRFAPATDGSGRFQYETVSATVGCVAHCSISALPDGRVVWLARDGFYVFDGASVSPISAELSHELKNLNKSRMIQACALTDASGEYRCWVPMNGSRSNNVCFVYDGQGWRQRTDVEASAVCVTQDHRAYSLIAGVSSGRHPSQGSDTSRNGVWVIDNEVYSYQPASRDATIETSWIAYDRPAARTSALSIDIWLREANSGEMTVEVFRDWRMSPVVQTITDFELHATDDIPPFWGTSVYDAAKTPAGTPNTYRRKRPYWRRVHISVPSCEVYKIRISTKSSIEFLGFVFQDQPKDLGGSRTPP